MSAGPGNSNKADSIPTRNGDPASEPAESRARLAEIRCGFAERARKEADAADGRVVEAKKHYGEQLAAVARAEGAIHPSAVQEAKDEAHRAFRAAVAVARGRADVEAAATAWLREINRINGETRIAQARVRREREKAETQLEDLAGLSDLAEASVAMADSAMHACRAARAALEAGEEPRAVAPTAAAEPKPAPAAASAATAHAAVQASPPAATGAVAPAAESPPPVDWLRVDLRAPEPQVITGLMRRDGRTMARLVERLADGDAQARARWGVLLSSLVDSIAAVAIEEACLDFPAANPFWGQFTPAQAREIARGLAALGFRYDGFGAFVDGRVPLHRDLALAIGSAGLLPARVRTWPRPNESENLYRGVTVSADTFIAARAPALTLGELVRLLGHRAQLLADLWNEWPRVRPFLFEANL